MKQVNLKIKEEVLHILCEDIYLNTKHVVIHFPADANIYDIMKMSMTFGVEFYKYSDGHAALTFPIEAVFNIKHLPNE